MSQGYLIDLHCHTAERSYDGRIPVVDLVRGVRERGFHGVVLTDHNQTWTPTELAEVLAECGAGREFVLLAGQEVRAFEAGDTILGDLLVYGPTEPIPDGTDVLDVLRLARNAGGFCIGAHVGAKKVGLGDRAGDFPLAAVETWNGRYGEKVGATSRQVAKRFGLVEVGGSDAHTLSDIGGGGTLFPKLPKSLAELHAMVRRGDGTPWKPPLVDRLKRRWQRRNEVEELPPMEEEGTAVDE